MTDAVQMETHGFQTEVKQLLNLMAHSLYSNKEVFLRELISNAADAADKLRFRALSEASLYEDDGQLRVRLILDKENKTLTISDNGIGLTRDQAIEHLGTIAKSGTAEFFSHLSGDQAKDSQLIGQFGVGFYSAFIVADKVTVLSRAAGVPAEQGVSWESDGSGSFSVATIHKASRVPMWCCISRRRSPSFWMTGVCAPSSVSTLITSAFLWRCGSCLPKVMTRRVTTTPSPMASGNR